MALRRVIIAGGGIVLFPQSASADVFHGIQKILAGIIRLPADTLVGTFTGPPVMGTISGIVSGTVQSVGLVGSGLVDLAASAVSLAKLAGPYVLPFLL